MNLAQLKEEVDKAVAHAQRLNIAAAEVEVFLRTPTEFRAPVREAFSDEDDGEDYRGHVRSGGKRELVFDIFQEEDG